MLDILQHEWLVNEDRVQVRMGCTFELSLYDYDSQLACEPLSTEA